LKDGGTACFEGLRSAASIWLENGGSRGSGFKNWGVASPKSSTDEGM